MLDDEEISAQIIGASIAVHKQLGPGFLESIYEEALAIELDFLRIPYERQKPIQIFYRNCALGEHRLDFLVAQRVVVELKAIQALDKIHFSIVRSYLKATQVQSGLLINFATMPLTVKRAGREDMARRKVIS